PWLEQGVTSAALQPWIPAFAGKTNNRLSLSWRLLCRAWGRRRLGRRCLDFVRLDPLASARSSRGVGAAQLHARGLGVLTERRTLPDLEAPFGRLRGGAGLGSLRHQDREGRDHGPHCILSFSDRTGRKGMRTAPRDANP